MFRFVGDFQHEGLSKVKHHVHRRLSCLENSLKLELVVLVVLQLSVVLAKLLQCFLENGFCLLGQSFVGDEFVGEEAADHVNHGVILLN
jgi:hypothetical protein